MVLKINFSNSEKCNSGSGFAALDENNFLFGR